MAEGEPRGGGQLQDHELPKRERGLEAYAMSHVIRQELNSVPNIRRAPELNTSFSITRRFSYEKGNSRFIGEEYILYNPNNTHSESFVLTRYNRGEETVYFCVVNDYRNNQLEGGSVSMTRGNDFAINTDPAVNNAWKFVESELGTPQDQSAQ